MSNQRNRICIDTHTHTHTHTQALDSVTHYSHCNSFAKFILEHPLLTFSCVALRMGRTPSLSVTQ